MPHLNLEYTNNIEEGDDFSDLFASINHMVSEKLPADIASCKCRAILVDNYYVGNGNSEAAFVHVELSFMQGRSAEIREEVGKELFQLLKTYFSDSAKRKDFQITLEVRELAKPYLKWNS